MKQQIIERFPGIGCAWADAAGKETAEYIGSADKESRCWFLLLKGRTLLSFNISCLLTTNMVNMRSIPIKPAIIRIHPDY